MSATATATASTRTASRHFASPRQDGAVFASIILAGASMVNVSAKLGVTAGDAIALALSPVILSVLKSSRQARILLILTFVQMLAIFSSDTLHHVSTQRALGACVDPLLTLVIGLAVFALLRSKPGSLRFILAVFFGSHFLYFVVHPTDNVLSDPWKFLVAIPVTFIMIIWLAVRPLHTPARLRTAALLLVVLSAVNLFAGFRSLAATTLLSAVVCAFGGSRTAWSPRKIVFASVASAFALFGLYTVYGHVASNGSLGATQQTVYAYQGNTNAGLLATARPGLFLSTTAIRHHPLFGIGTSMPLSSDEQSEAFGTMSGLGLSVELGQQLHLTENGVESHSILLGAWVEAGPLAMAPLVYVFVLGLSACRRQTRTGIYPLLVLWTAFQAWDLLFSPWSQHYQYLLGPYVGLMLFARTYNEGGESGA